MHDARNCGWCGHDCRIGACTDGVCPAATVSTTVQVEAIAVDEASVYWTDSVLDEVHSCARDPLTAGGDCKVLMDGAGAGMAIAPRGLALTNDRFVTNDEAQQVIVLCNKGGCGGGFTPVDHAKTAGHYPFAIAADELYWSEPARFAATEVHYVKTSADTHTSVVRAARRVIVASASGAHHLFWIDDAGIGTAVVPYPADDPFASFTPRVVFGGVVHDAAVTSDTIWAARSDGLHRVPRAGGPPVRVAEGNFRRVVADDDGVYAQRDATLVSLRPDGRVIAMAKTDSVGPLALDARWVYYATPVGAAQELRRVAR